NEGALSYVIDGPVGSVLVSNLRTALATTNYILSGNGKESYHPTMTYYGYRYLEFVASDTVTFDTIRSQVITNVQRDSGNIVTSNEKLNQLISNTRWGQYSNFVGVPTDCPQRDERAGWLADTWVFAVTGQYYSADTKAFLEKWMDDVVDCQTADGRYQSGSPGGGAYGTPLGRTGWADAALIVPYNMYLMTGDSAMIREHYASMQLYVDGYLATTDKKGADGWYGDWLAPGDNNDDTVKEMLGVIFYAWDAQLMAEMARIIGKTEDVAHYEALYQTEKEYFIQKYVNTDGSLISKRQTPALYALYLDLLPDETSKAVVKRELLANIEENSYMLSTGFLGTPILLDVLTDEGEQDIAYRILMQEGNPSWLFAVNAGATTVWENWAGCAENGAFLSGSLNHYAYGSVVGWIYKYMAGIGYDESTPGFKKILLAPHPDQMIESVSATYDSPYGEIKSAWSYDGGAFAYHTVLPANTTAQIRVPVEEMDTLQVNGKAYTALTTADDGIVFTAVEEGVAVFEAVAGSYTFTANVEEKSYLTLSAQGNDGIPTYVTINGKDVLLPTRLEVEPGQSVELSAFCANSVDYPVVAWQDAGGNTLSQKKSFTFAAENGNTDLSVVLKDIGMENVAQGAAVTAKFVNNTWHYSYLTDGKRTHLMGTNGWSSPYQGQNVAFAAPVEAVLDLGERKTFNRLHLYPRTDQTAGKTTPMNFPVAYTVYISDDNATWTPLVQVRDGEAATWRPAVHILEKEAQAQYIKLSVTAVNQADGSGNCYVQLAEFGVYNFSCEHSSTTLIVERAPTCGTSGIGHKDCIVCGKTVETDVVIPVTEDHIPAAEITPVIPPTCGTEGVGKKICTVCGEDAEIDLVIPATGAHTPGDWVVVKEATTSAKGLKEKYCTVCGAKVDSASIPKKAPAVSFTDVKKSDFFYTPVQWAVANGVTSGTSKTTFSPSDACTRAQAVTFLWRAAGSPAPKSSKNPFTDVKKSDYFYKAVLWAVENDITAGTSKTAFSPEESCTRGQIVSFLWRAQGSEKVSATNPFTDVKKKDYYYYAVLWAVKNNVTAGATKTTFAPNDVCTRGQIVTFLYRAVA
ncbi:MAG: family 78 glycoside hydrolase catalytic domain, partial [Clostridia bacterium]|nr:family 78 glycoside hydrolase catalytic domain [Clostridia bacterium]